MTSLAIFSVVAGFYRDLSSDSFSDPSGNLSSRCSVVLWTHHVNFSFKVSVVGDTFELTGKYKDRGMKYLQKLKAEQERALAKAKKPIISAAASSTAVCLV